MFETEYVRNLHCNYERFLLPQKPEEKRYQYCILSRGGIRGLLSCSLRYVNGKAYLYYDITSRQNVAQLYQKSVIDRKWLGDFIESVRQLQLELERFLLQEHNILWEPDQIFQDLEKNEFSFIYIPYFEGENRFLKLLGFLVEHIDYEDDRLVECVYRMYEQMEKNGEIYLQEKIFEDVRLLEETENPGGRSSEVMAGGSSFSGIQEGEPVPVLLEEGPIEIRQDRGKETGKETGKGTGTETGRETGKETRTETGREAGRETGKETGSQGVRKSLLSLFENKKGKGREREQRESYHEFMQQKLDGYKVAEDAVYEERDFGQTVYLDTSGEEKEILHRLYSSDGKILARLDTPALLLGKARERVDVYLEDISVSRMHARLVKNREEVSLEDLNSTNGTYLNGIQLQPYEKKRLEPGDEIRCGKIVLQYR